MEFKFDFLAVDGVPTATQNHVELKIKFNEDACEVVEYQRKEICVYTVGIKSQFTCVEYVP